MSYPGFIVLSTDNGPAYLQEAQGDGAALVSNIVLEDDMARYISLQRTATFTVGGISGIASTVQKAKWCGTVWVAVCESGVIYTSPTGEDGTWTYRNSNMSIQLLDIVYGNGIIVVVGNTNNVSQPFITYSLDAGVTWTQNSGLVGLRTLLSVDYNPLATCFTFIGYEDGSTDGTGCYVTGDPTSTVGDWRPTPWTGTFAWGAYRAGVLWVNSVSGPIYYSNDDGLNWNYATNLGYPVSAMTLVGTKLALVKNNSFLLSSDGVNWDTYIPYPSSNAFAVCGDEHDIFVSGQGYIFRYDPVTLSSTPLLGFIGDPYTIACSPYEWVAMGFSGLGFSAERRFTAKVYPTSADRAALTNELGSITSGLINTPGTVTIPGQLSFDVEDLTT